MAEKQIVPAGAGVFLLAGVVGVLVCALCLMGCASCMEAQGWSQSMAGPLSSASVGIGSLCGGTIAAFLRREHGLLTGAVQGFLFAAILAALLAGSGGTLEGWPVIRMGIALACSSLGGLLGLSLAEKTRRVR